MRDAARPFLFRARGDVVDQPDVGQAHGEGQDDRAGDVGHFLEGVRMGDSNVVDARVKLALDVRPHLGDNPAGVALALFDPFPPRGEGVVQSRRPLPFFCTEKDVARSVSRPYRRYQRPIGRACDAHCCSIRELMQKSCSKDRHEQCREVRFPRSRGALISIID